MGGGGSKGAFQAGAVYHLVAIRGCDFTEIDGTSSGALNAGLLAQAAQSRDEATSLRNMTQQAEALVAMWQQIHGTKDIVKGRPLASLRFGLFGLEGLKNFEPLKKLLKQNVSLERLDNGRELRVGTVSFHDGLYHEVTLNPNGVSDRNALDYLFGSAIMPMYGVMPRIPAKMAEGTMEPVQFGDGSTRHMVPLGSYFVMCTGADAQGCRERGTHGALPHQPLEQLFIIITSPYDRNHETKAMFNPAAFKQGTHQITDGRKLMGRALDVIIDTVQHTDLDTLLDGNDLLAWREHNASDKGAFPIESYNYDPANTGKASRPYQVGIVAPDHEMDDMSKTLEFSPQRIAEQMYCGCMAADRMMVDKFGAGSEAGKCGEKFKAGVNGACFVQRASGLLASGK